MIVRRFVPSFALDHDRFVHPAPIHRPARAGRIAVGVRGGERGGCALGSRKPARRRRVSPPGPRRRPPPPPPRQARTRAETPIPPPRPAPAPHYNAPPLPAARLGH